MDSSLPIATLFLHENLVAWTLAFELDLKQWRLAEIEGSRGDLGRPNYLDAFAVSNILCPSFYVHQINLTHVPGAFHRAPLA